MTYPLYPDLTLAAQGAKDFVTQVRSGAPNKPLLVKGGLTVLNYGAGVVVGEPVDGFGAGATVAPAVALPDYPALASGAPIPEMSEEQALRELEAFAQGADDGLKGPITTILSTILINAVLKIMRKHLFP